VIERNEKIQEATPFMRLVSLKRGKKCAKMETAVKFENTNNSYVKFFPEIEKNDGNIF